MSDNSNSNLFRFLIVGAINAAIHFIVLSAFYKLAGFGIVSSTVIAFTCAVIFSYQANYFYTFRSKQPHTSSVPRFASTVILGLFFNASIMLIGVEKLGANFYLVFVLATGVVMINSFLLNKYWVYK